MIILKNIFLKAKANVWVLLLIALFFKILVSFLFHALVRSANIIGAGNTGLDDLTTLETIIAIVIIAPLLETFIFQFGVQEVVIRAFKNSVFKLWISVFISSLAFALTHYYSLFYILMTLVSGLIYSVFYIIIRDRTKKIGASFFLTSLLHIGYNLFEFLRNGEF